MQLSILTILLACLSAICFAAPVNDQLNKRQTYYITCIGGSCYDGSTPTPTPKPTSKTSRKPEPPKYTPDPPEYTPDLPKHTPTPTPTPIKTPTKTTSKSTLKPTKTGEGEVGPSSTACPVPLYYQCGGYYDGVPWSGCTKCVKGAKCVVQNEFYNQCVADE